MVKKLFPLLLLLVLFASCGPREYPKIALDQLDPKLKKTGSTMVADILKSIKHKDGPDYLLDKNYITTKLHVRVKHNMAMYQESFLMTSLLLGKVNKYQLFQVIDKGLVKTMRYKLESEGDGMQFIELKIDVNIDFELVAMYLYLSSSDGELKRENCFPSFKD